MNRTTLIVLSIAAVLVVLLLVFENPFREEPTISARTEAPVELFQPIAPQDASRIQISGTLASTATLVNQGGQWFMADGVPADPGAVNQLFAALEQAKEPELISINADVLEQFHIGPVLGTRLRIFDLQNKPRVDVVVGEVERDIFNSAIRRPDSANVYRVHGMLRRALRPASWRDLALLRLNPDTIRAITVRTTETTLAVRREPGAATWAFADPTTETIPPDSMNTWLQRLANSRAANIVATSAEADALTSYGLTQPGASLAVVTDDGTTHTLLFGGFKGNPPAGTCYAKRADAPLIYEVNEISRGNLLMTRAALTQPPAPPAGAGMSPGMMPPGMMPPSAMPPGAMPPAMMVPGGMPPDLSTAPVR